MAWAPAAASSRRTLPGLIRRPEKCGFDVLPAGSSSRSVQKLFRAERFTQILAEARERYDYVLLDTPPLVPVYDAAVLARQVDGVILVVAADKTPRKLLGAALDLLDASKVVGPRVQRRYQPAVWLQQPRLPSVFHVRTRLTNVRHDPTCRRACLVASRSRPRDRDSSSDPMTTASANSRHRRRRATTPPLRRSWPLPRSCWCRRRHGSRRSRACALRCSPPAWRLCRTSPAAPLRPRRRYRCGAKW